ncbi:M20/M25/M40 family metallo-hydrolase [Ktedonosporobacter rubrisoli]|nr:M20/M25/M40 family metallo-hydrolase [Ktedonosporobacter rubrisoli]
MPKQSTIRNDWYNVVQEYTERLVKIRSVSPGEGEIRVAHEVLRQLTEGDVGSLYTMHGLDPIEGDPYQRQNAYAFLHGQSSATLVLLGHIDTVDTQDYGPLEPWALEPNELTLRKKALFSSPTAAEEADDDWMFGRGAIDMKSGVAVNIALMRRLAQANHQSPLPLSVVMLATPDEENESAGVLQAVHFLLRLRELYGLEYLGVINTDSTTALYPGDQQRYIYSGTIGKLLPCFLCVGSASHVATPFNGLDANLLAAELIRELSMNDSLCDVAQGQVTAPPVTLHAKDLKDHYDVQLPFAAYFYLNVLTLNTGPDELLQRLCACSSTVMRDLLQRVDQAEQRWRQASGEHGWQERFQPRHGSVLTYAQLYTEAVKQLGEDQVQAALDAEWQRASSLPDARERSLCLAQRLWKLSNRQGPAVVIFYAPPYYPHVAPTPGALQDAISNVVAAHPEIPLEILPYYPYLSDMSYLRLDPGINLSAFTQNMPIWQESGTQAQIGAYKLPLAEIQKLALPVINWGPYGYAFHQRDERVLKSYSFETLPQLIYETIMYLAQNSAS